jgi:pimeloyl-ACP methyl ester carboxylesterase
MELQLKPPPEPIAPPPRLEVLHTSDGLRLSGDRWAGDGAAPDLLYLHGFGQTRQAWGNTALRLAQAGYGGLALDGRGHGTSQRNGPDVPYSMDQFIDDVHGAARLFPHKPVLVGASMGGLLGVVTEGETDGGLYSALVLVDITPRWESGGVARILDFMGAHPDGFADFDEAADAISGYLPHRRRRKTPAELAPLLVQRDDGRWCWHWDPRMLDQVARDGERYQPRLIEAARRVRVPTLLVSGGLSDLVSDRTVEEFLALVPHAEHVRIPDATHMVAGDRNDAFTGAILDFLTSSRSRGAFGPGAVP